MRKSKDTYWKTFLSIPRHKIDWYFKYYLNRIFGFTFDKLKDQREYWNTRGKEYYKSFFETSYYKYEIFFQDLLIGELRNLEFNSIFEAGCGFGWNIKRIKEEFPESNVAGVDFSLPQLYNGKYRYFKDGSEISVVGGDITELPYINNAFNVGFSLGVFMNIHPDKIGRAIDEMIRVSKNYIIHLEWDQDHTTSELRKRRVFKTNIISHNYKELYESRGKKILRFETYKNFGTEFYQKFKSTKVFRWEQYEGPEKYIFMVVEL